MLLYASQMDIHSPDLRIACSKSPLFAGKVRFLHACALQLSFKTSSHPPIPASRCRALSIDVILEFGLSLARRSLEKVCQERVECSPAGEGEALIALRGHSTAAVLWITGGLRRKRNFSGRKDHREGAGSGEETEDYGLFSFRLARECYRYNSPSS